MRTTEAYLGKTYSWILDSWFNNINGKVLHSDWLREMQFRITQCRKEVSQCKKTLITNVPGTQIGQ